METGTFNIVELRVVRTQEEFSRIRSEWDGLLQKFDPVPLPMTYGWLRSWWDAFAHDSRMEFRCLYRAGTLIGIAPLLRTRELYRGIPVTILKLAANGHSPYSSVMVDPSIEGHERAQMFSALTQVEATEVGLFFKIPQGGDLRRFLLDRTRGGYEQVGEKPGLSTPVIHIDNTWDEFYKARPKKLKRSLKHKLNRFEKNTDFSISVENVARPDQPIVEEIVEISASSWKSRIGNDLGSNQRSRRFLQNLIESFGESGALSAWIIRHKKQPVAYELHVTCDGIVYPIRADYDMSFKAYSPGSILEYTTLKHLFESCSARQYYTCADDYWYLSNWTSDYQEICTIEIFGNCRKLRFLYWMEYRLIPVLKRFLRKNSHGLRHAQLIEGKSNQ
ncbi:GNAT family N-acetyltransferase [Marinobacter sp. NP-4(2019)]|nr:GNAT family N-acetyltransferase [Marinobacter sp. NP-4(2019)]